MSNLAIVVVVVLILLLLGAWPTWPHAVSWGYYPSGIFAFVLLVVLILALLGKL